MKKAQVILFFLFSFMLLVECTHHVLAEEITLTEEQKQELQRSLQEKLEKMKKDIEKIKTLSDSQGDRESKSTMESSELPLTEERKTLSAEPEWDGIYILTDENRYIEVKTLRTGTARPTKRLLTGEKYVSLTLRPEEINSIPWQRFKGLLFKGPQVTYDIDIKRMTPLKALGIEKVISFLSGVPGGEEYTLDNPKENLRKTDMKCRTRTDTVYCEFTDRDGVLSYLSNRSKRPCIIMAAGDTAKEGKLSAICFDN